MVNDITIAICNYNSACYIERTLNSIINQSYKKFKLLIIDDFSADNSCEFADKILSKSLIDYNILRFNSNHGICYARQHALKLAKTKYIIFIDSDDLAHEHLIKKLHKVIETDSDIIGVNCWSEFIDGNDNKIKGGLYLGTLTKDEYISRSKKNKLHFMPIQCLFNREAALRVGGLRLEGFPEGKPRYQDFCEDLDLWTRMSDLYTEGKYMITIPEVLYSYRKTGLGLSSNRLLMILKMKFVKINLKRRRRGEEEITFTDFLNSYSKEEMALLEKESEVATLLGNGVFLFNSGKRAKGLKLILLSFVKDPSYLWQKLLANTRLFK